MRRLCCTLLSLIFVVSCVTARAQVSFFQPPTYAGNGNVFVADFNNDGKPDILTSDGTMNLGKGDGTFTQGTSVSGTVLAVADFNGDGKPDVLEQGTGTLLVLLGNGDGTFQAPVGTPSGASLVSVGAADLNGDGKADVVGIFNSSLVVYVSKGDATFQPGVSYALGVTQASLAPQPNAAFGDFNNDGKMDVVVSASGYKVAGSEVMFLGNGDGTFQAAKVSAGSVCGLCFSQFVAIGDFNGDGKLDLAISAQTSDVYIFLGNGDGTFQPPTLDSSGPGGRSLPLISTATASWT